MFRFQYLLADAIFTSIVLLLVYSIIHNFRKDSRIETGDFIEIFTMGVITYIILDVTGFQEWSRNNRYAS